MSIAALIVSVGALLISNSAYRIEFAAADGRIDKHRVVATAFSDFVEGSCIAESNSLCEMYLRNTRDYLETYAAAVERESSRLTDRQYDSHVWEMQRIRITLAAAEL
jgi:hypothetical protein